MAPLAAHYMRLATTVLGTWILPALVGVSALTLVTFAASLVGNRGAYPYHPIRSRASANYRGNEASRGCGEVRGREPPDYAVAGSGRGA